MLTKSQSTAIEQIKEFIKNDMTVHCLSGSPGTGKSYLIETEIPKLLRNTPYFLVQQLLIKLQQLFMVLLYVKHLVSVLKLIWIQEYKTII